MRRFREHRGGLEESLETTFQFETEADLLAHIAKILERSNRRLGRVETDAGPGHRDPRIGWNDVRLVLVNGTPFGWVEGELSDRGSSTESRTRDNTAVDLMKIATGSADSFGWLKRGDLPGGDLDYWESPEGEIKAVKKGYPLMLAKAPKLKW